MNESELTPDQIMRNGSRTYYWATRFFPHEVVLKVQDFYAFVRVADDYVDQTTPDTEGFYRLVDQTTAALNGEITNNPIVDNYVALAREYDFDKEWIYAFLTAMEGDLTQKTYDTFEELVGYTYGSAEVIGLQMARILELDPALDERAMLLGRAMQIINFVRDFQEDLDLGRMYLPISEMRALGVEPEQMRYDQNPEIFTQFMRMQIDRYIQIDEEARLAFPEIPWRYRVPINIAADMYRWTANRIYERPEVVFETKVKPPKEKILLTGAKIFLTTKW